MGRSDAEVLALITLALLISSQVAESASSAGLPNDPILPRQWGWFAIGADKAYETGYRGQGIIVAVLDTGVNYTHPDLSANVLVDKGFDFTTYTGDVMDTDGHGTMCAGIIAAIANNGIGIAGVAPEVKILPLKVMPEWGATWVNIAPAILYAVDRGAKVISMSFGGRPRLLEFPSELAIKSAYRRGCVLVAAAGNENTSTPQYPAAYEEVIAVSSVDQDLKLSSFSNYGSWIDLCAPGRNVTSTYKRGYAVGSGTSFAAPYVAGVVALMLSKHPNLTPDQVKATLYKQATDLGDPGWDPYYGHGLVNAYAAVTGEPILEFSSPGTLLFFSIFAVLALPILLRGFKKHGRRQGN